MRGRTSSGPESERAASGPIRTLAGSCLCGGVTYRCEAPLVAVARCHCVECRKQSGAEHATNGEPRRGSFWLETGGELLRAFESSPGQLRVFCGRCGSPIMKRYANDPDRVRLRLGLLDDDLEEEPEIQVFASEKMGLTRIDTTIPTFERGFDSPRYSPPSAGTP
ncbi:MAG: GFA family protein [Myxococcota bacterium]